MDEQDVRAPVHVAIHGSETSPYTTLHLRQHSAGRKGRTVANASSIGIILKWWRLRLFCCRLPWIISDGTFGAGLKYGYVNSKIFKIREIFCCRRGAPKINNISVWLTLNALNFVLKIEKFWFITLTRKKMTVCIYCVRTCEMPEHIDDNTSASHDWSFSCSRRQWRHHLILLELQCLLMGRGCSIL